jgi:hypothetical protein
MKPDPANADVPPEVIAHLGVHHVRPEATDPLGLARRVLARRGGDRVRLYLDRVGAPKAADVRGRLAEMLVRESMEREPAVAVGILHCPTFGARLWSDVVRFIDTFAPRAGVVMVGDHGRLAVHVPVFGSREAPVRPPTAEQAPADVPLFTDLNRWLLKVLLLRVAPERYRPRTLGAIRSQVELAREADVSPATVHRLWTRLVRDGHLTLSPEPRLARVRQLLASWIALDAQARPLTLPARAIVAHGWSVDALLRSSVGPRRALTGTEAAVRHGVRFGFVSGAVPEVVFDAEPSAACAAWRLAPCAPHEATVLLTRTATPESVFRGLAEIDGTPVVDVLQAGLDAARQPMLGVAQAEHIAAIVAGWHER